MHDQDEQDTSRVSKTTRKRDASALQKLGLRLTELKAAHLELLALPAKLLAAIFDYQRFASREAKRRQIQFIGKVMRDVDVDAITKQLDKLEGQSALGRAQLHQTEIWREKLLTDNDALTQFITHYPHVERQRLRHLVKKARTELSQQSSTKTNRTEQRALFRYLRSCTEQPDE